MSKKTPLHQAHEQAGAKLVDFHGWTLPIHYGSQIEEHHAARQDAGMFDVSHMTIVDFTGAELEDFLRRLVTNDVAKIVPGQALYTVMCNEQAGIIDDLIIYKREQGYRLILNAATFDDDMAWLEKQAANVDIDYQVRSDLAMLAVQGPAAREKAAKALPKVIVDQASALKPFYFTESGDVFVARTGYTGEDGFEVVMPAAEIEHFWNACLTSDIKPCGLGARDTLRLEAGLNLYGNDMDLSHHALESNVAWTVAFVPENRDFIGRSALEMLKAKGGYPALLGLVLLDRGVLREHLSVFKDGKQIGETTSGTFSPTLQKGVAFARIHAAPGDTVQVEVRNKLLNARVVKLPFVRKGKIMIEEIH
ncbi:MAG: glycine cleavage system protein T [Gammaproteobacteria bacterium CG11_big_fil_rev_8_21_14_0_20_46_22]|nr:MAG: glycine cleavage system protein T [Gammaproteobacteria bacterium CG12_big_fil_rev_8_21_14_0_65_46_12]PIR10324.1 MAG: glycine cleavage system protein T [Gammaproteobacteria bacterium CG11_big_fil_rev_8_21_14_0_20_46_22]